jgi:hypothetical protein
MKLVTDFIHSIWKRKRERVCEYECECVCVCILVLILTNILHCYAAFVMNNHYNEEKVKQLNHYLENCSFEQKPRKKIANKINQSIQLITCG